MNDAINEVYTNMSASHRLTYSRIKYILLVIITTTTAKPVKYANHLKLKLTN